MEEIRDSYVIVKNLLENLVKEEYLKDEYIKGAKKTLGLMFLSQILDQAILEAVRQHDYTENTIKDIKDIMKERNESLEESFEDFFEIFDS